MKGNGKPGLGQTVVFVFYNAALPVNEVLVSCLLANEEFSSSRPRVSSGQAKVIPGTSELEKPANPQENLHSLRLNVVRI
jgi:hypothetical protein